jgi:hypothetical protein
MSALHAEALRAEHESALADLSSEEGIYPAPLGRGARPLIF